MQHTQNCCWRGDNKNTQDIKGNLGKHVQNSRRKREYGPLGERPVVPWDWNKELESRETHRRCDCGGEQLPGHSRPFKPCYRELLKVSEKGSDMIKFAF